MTSVWFYVDIQRRAIYMQSMRIMPWALYQYCQFCAHYIPLLAFRCTGMMGHDLITALDYYNGPGPFLFLFCSYLFEAVPAWLTKRPSTLFRLQSEIPRYNTTQAVGIQPSFGRSVGLQHSDDTPSKRYVVLVCGVIGVGGIMMNIQNRSHGFNLLSHLAMLRVFLFFLIQRTYVRGSKPSFPTHSARRPELSNPWWHFLVDFFIFYLC